MGGGEQRRFGSGGRGLLVHNPAGVDDDHPVADQGNFGQFAGVEQNGRAVGSQFPQQRVDFPFGLDVDAACGVKAEQCAETGHQPAANHHLLLVAARETAHLRSRPGINRQAINRFGDPLGFVAGDAQPAADVTKNGHSQILAHGQAGQQSQQPVAGD